MILLQKVPSILPLSHSPNLIPAPNFLGIPVLEFLYSTEPGFSTLLNTNRISFLGVRKGNIRNFRIIDGKGKYFAE